MRGKQKRKRKVRRSWFILSYIHTLKVREAFKGMQLEKGRGVNISAHCKIKLDQVKCKDWVWNRYTIIIEKRSKRIRTELCVAFSHTLTDQVLNSFQQVSPLHGAAQFSNVLVWCCNAVQNYTSSSSSCWSSLLASSAAPVCGVAAEWKKEMVCAFPAKNHRSVSALGLMWSKNKL
jgi:hypothetical protein